MEKEQERELWREFGKGKNASARLALIDHYTYLAKVNASHYYRISSDGDIEYGDYLQNAILGLIEAVDRYDPDRGASFATYANYRIKGAVLNGMEKATEQREQSAYLRKHQRSRVESIATKSNLGNEDPFARMVEVTIELALSFMLEDTGLLQNDEHISDTLYDEKSMQGLSQHLGELVDSLPHRERLIIRSHYYHAMAFEDLANLLEISKGRVSQLHKRALQMIRVAYEAAEGFDAQY